MTGGGDSLPFKVGLPLHTFNLNDGPSLKRHKIGPTVDGNFVSYKEVYYGE